MRRDHRHPSSRLAAAGVLAAAVCLTSTVHAQAVTDADTASLTPAMVDLGRAIFHGKGMCFACHGAALEGTQMAPTLKGHVWRDAKGGGYSAIVGVLLKGVSSTAMVSLPGGISEAEAKSVAAYVWSVSHRAAKP